MKKFVFVLFFVCLFVVLDDVNAEIIINNSDEGVYGSNVVVDSEDTWSIVNGSNITINGNLNIYGVLNLSDSILTVTGAINIYNNETMIENSTLNCSENIGINNYADLKIQSSKVYVNALTTGTSGLLSTLIHNISIIDSEFYASGDSSSYSMTFAQSTVNITNSNITLAHGINRYYASKYVFTYSRFKLTRFMNANATIFDGCFINFTEHMWSSGFRNAIELKILNTEIIVGPESSIDIIFGGQNVEIINSSLINLHSGTYSNEPIYLSGVSEANFTIINSNITSFSSHSIYSSGSNNVNILLQNTSLNSMDPGGAGLYIRNSNATVVIEESTISTDFNYIYITENSNVSLLINNSSVYKYTFGSGWSVLEVSDSQIDLQIENSNLVQAINQDGLKFTDSYVTLFGEFTQNMTLDDCSVFGDINITDTNDLKLKNSKVNLTINVLKNATLYVTNVSIIDRPFYVGDGISLSENATLIDNSNPFVNITSSEIAPDGVYNLTWIGFDVGWGIANYTIYVNDSEEGIYSKDVLNTTLNVLYGETINLTIVAYDNISNTEFCTIFVTYLDVTPPIYRNITGSNQYVNYNDEHTITINVTDDIQVDTVLIELDGINYTMENSSIDIYEYSLTTSDEGINNFTIYMNDTYNNWNKTEKLNFTVQDLSPPTYSNLKILDVERDNTNILSLSNTTYLNFQLKVSLDVLDPSGVSKVVLEYNGSNQTMSGDPYYTTIYAAEIGENVITIYMNDSYNNYNVTTVAFNVETDNTPPTYKVVSPIEEYIYDTSVNFDINISDNSVVAWAGYQNIIIYKENGEVLNQTLYSRSGFYPYDTYGDIISSLSGTIIYHYELRDVFGNVNVTKNRTITIVNNNLRIRIVSVNVEVVEGVPFTVTTAISSYSEVSLSDINVSFYFQSDNLKYYIGSTLVDILEYEIENVYTFEVDSKLIQDLKDIGFSKGNINLIIIVNADNSTLETDYNDNEISFPLYLDIEEDDSSDGGGFLGICGPTVLIGLILGPAGLLARKFRK